MSPRGIVNLPSSLVSPVISISSASPKTLPYKSTFNFVTFKLPTLYSVPSGSSSITRAFVRDILCLLIVTSQLISSALYFLLGVPFFLIVFSLSPKLIGILISPSSPIGSKIASPFSTSTSLSSSLEIISTQPLTLLCSLTQSVKVSSTFLSVVILSFATIKLESSSSFNTPFISSVILIPFGK